MLHSLIHFDTWLMLWLNSLHTPFWDTFMYIVTSKWTWIPMYCVILYVLWWKYGLKIVLMWTIIMVIVAITFSDQMCGSVIRDFVERARPSQPDSHISNMIHLVNNYHGGHYGFPSCHAGNSFALATLLALIFRNRKLNFFIFFWALLNSYSRIYCGVHYPGDILVGAIVGSVGAIGTFYAFRYALRLKHESDYRQVNVISFTGLATMVVILIYSGIAMVV
jgi:undecaprenyl-diphosphatase